MSSIPGMTCGKNEEDDPLEVATFRGSQRAIAELKLSAAWYRYIEDISDLQLFQQDLQRAAPAVQDPGNGGIEGEDERVGAGERTGLSIVINRRSLQQNNGSVKDGAGGRTLLSLLPIVDSTKPLSLIAHLEACVKAHMLQSPLVMNKIALDWFNNRMTAEERYEFVEGHKELVAAWKARTNDDTSDEAGGF